MSNTMPYTPTFLNSKEPRTMGALYLAKAPPVRRITTPTGVPLPVMPALPRFPIEISPDEEDTLVEIEVDLSQLRDTTPSPGYPYLQPGYNYYIVADKETDVDLITSMEWSITYAHPTGCEEFVCTAEIYHTLCYVWRNDSTNQFLAQVIPPQEL
jgi:hypothetical protein